MKEHFLNIGEYHIGRGAGIITCRGLGSCVALFLYDRSAKVSGGAHIFLPEKKGSNSNQVADYLMNQLLVNMHSLGANVKQLRAQIIGGASLMMSDQFNIGERNVSKVKELLIKNRIFLAHQEVGGQCSRSVKFNMLDGKISIKSYLKNSYGK